MARHMGPKIQDFIEQKLEAWLGLKLNRDKTRIVNLRRPEERLEFLDYQVGLAPCERIDAAITGAWSPATRRWNAKWTEFGK